MNKLFSKFKFKRKKGYTLFEVLVVLIILVVLAAIAVPTYNKVIKRSRVADGLHVLDMLAGAQEKYFIQHNRYSASLAALNAPIKKKVTVEGVVYENLITANFTYKKVPTQHCIQAVSNISGSDYTLVKNYKTHDKVQCSGPFCEEIKDFVSPVDNLAELCPNDQEPCELNEDICAQQFGNGFGFLCSTCECKKCPCDMYNSCQASGGMLNEENCECIGGNQPCSVEGATEWIQTNNACGKQGSGKRGRGIDPGSLLPIINLVCGVEWQERICTSGFWQLSGKTECRPKECPTGTKLNEKTCECDKSCSLPKPSVSEICMANAHPIEVCNPCSNDISGTRGSTPPSSQQCCGYRSTEDNTVECNGTTGQWYCANNNECIEVNGDIGQDCDGTDLYSIATPGNTCGSKVFSSCELNDSYSGVDLITACKLKSGSACFTGQTKEEGCTNGFVKICQDDCQWSKDCFPDPNQNCDPNTMLPAAQVGDCQKKKQECVKDSDGNWHWQYTEEIEFLHPWYNCEQNGLREYCYSGDCNDGTSQNTGGRGSGDNCCSYSDAEGTCAADCIGCGIFSGGYEPDVCRGNQCYSCLSGICGPNIVYCQSGGGQSGGGGAGGGAGGGGGGGGQIPLPPNWNYVPNSNDPTAPPIWLPLLNRVCQECKWSPWSLCDASAKPADYDSGCATYKSECWAQEGYTQWLSGSDMYNPPTSNGIAEWHLGNNCENVEQPHSCSLNGLTGFQRCESCRWSQCYTDAMCGVDNLSVIGPDSCSMYEHKCKENQDGTWTWQYDNQVVLLRPGAQCSNALAQYPTSDGINCKNCQLVSCPQGTVYNNAKKKCYQTTTFSAYFEYIPSDTGCAFSRLVTCGSSGQGYNNPHCSDSYCSDTSITTINNYSPSNQQTVTGYCRTTTNPTRVGIPINGNWNMNSPVPPATQWDTCGSIIPKKYCTHISSLAFRCTEVPW